MSSQPEEQPFSESHLESPEYRKRLLRKLNTLIAVLDEWPARRCAVPWRVRPRTWSA